MTFTLRGGCSTKLSYHGKRMRAISGVAVTFDVLWFEAWRQNTHSGLKSKWRCCRESNSGPLIDNQPICH